VKNVKKRENDKIRSRNIEENHHKIPKNKDDYKKSYKNPQEQKRTKKLYTILWTSVCIEVETVENKGFGTSPVGHLWNSPFGLSLRRELFYVRGFSLWWFVGLGGPRRHKS